MALDPRDITLLSQLLDQAMELTPAERVAWLAALPAEHQRHAEALREMLAREADLDTDDRLATMPRLPPGDESVAHAGDRVGPYALLREIGRGGMGSVWLAARADGSFKRQVALKLPRLAWGTGLAERMAREREIGALLEHPNIARLYDAGVDERGRPYLALEYIDGQPIDAWCEAQGLSVRDRLRLFVQVARAVAYAHGRLVVHRDLKPSNVMVTPDGQAHLLDFGIAKLLTDAATPEAGLTQQQGRVLTPHYASPEQVAGEAITVQSDVYSLGVLLYELLTNTLPIAPKRSTLGAVEEAILEGDAPLASSRVKDRATAKALRGEVDAILAKAMQREPGRRYATADAMAMDIERHLNGETVAARPDSLAYRLSKGLRRHWVGVTAAAAVMVAVLTGSGVAVVQAQRAAQSAERERVVKEFVFETFKTNTSGGAGGEDLRRLPAELLLARGARLIETKFVGQTELQAELYGVVARILLDMGASEQAIDYAIKQVESLSAIGAAPEQRAEAVLLVSEAFRGVGRLADAETRARAALSLAAPGGAVRLRTRLLLVELMVVDRRHDTAEAELNSTDQEIATAPEPHHLLEARSDFLRAGLLSDSNRFDKAKPLYQRAIDRTLAIQGPASTLVARMQIGFAGELLARSDAAAARPLYDAAFTTLRAAGGADEIAAVFEEADAARLLLEFDPTFTYSAADAILAHGLATLDRIGSRVPVVVRARVESIRGCSMEGWGEVTKGYALLSQSIAAVRAAALNGYTPGAGCLGRAAMDTGRHAEAERELSARLQHFTRGPAGRSPDKSPMYLHIAFNRVMQGQLSAARAALSAAPEFAPLQGTKEDATYYSAFIAAAHAFIDLEEGKYQTALDRLVGLEDEQYNLLDVEMIRGNAHCALGRWKSAWPLFDKGLLRLGANNSPNMPRLARWRAIAGLCRMAAGEKSVAMEMARLARAAFTAQPGVSPYYKAPLIQLERKLGLKLPPP